MPDRLDSSKPIEQFVDLQVNGYGGVDFNADGLTAEQLHFACQQLINDGVAGILATIITERLDLMVDRLQRLVQLRAADLLAQQVIWGIHIEGPFISAEPGYVGAHPADAVLPATREAANRLLDAAGGLTRIVTLAPECDAGFQVTRMLAEQGVVVAAGHCNPTSELLAEAIDAGMSMFTHLGNGCPPQLPRHDNIIQRVLGCSDRLTISFIADGVHIPPFSLRNYLRAVPPDRCVVVSDAIAAAGLGPGTYSLGRRTVDVGDDLAVRSEDRTHLVGSAVTMRRAAQVLQQQVGLPSEQIDEMCRQTPARILGKRAP